MSIFNPYLGLAPEKRVRINVDISTQDRDLIKDVFGRNGISDIVGTVLHNLTQELRKHGLKHYDPAARDYLYRWLHTVSTARLGQPDNGSVGDTDDANEAGRVATAHREVARPPNVGTNTDVPPKRRPRRRKDPIGEDSPTGGS